ncbi:DUF1573 domain-containing protein [Wenyingzhuangia sp. 2_MG-2023]|uniref:DUF1573 domain-containing protein n=1 Tax=Wenyingzhuangia sp. 2_MG-2023 TaxID=3062639 RepID=UPI0026E3CE80|nr:DUF1573 domain-containing protein [Wenyingzhuangia sp. 2_MG-2023]MDO6738890.1 DUF1573 domain-containing protein [Wenyingzhuangia sp. 2_MG-2023]MDO6802906.1 DUF1573 domain-containing protein [Wenyingzhuangia sp. 1_MG-2023]
MKKLIFILCMALMPALSFAQYANTDNDTSLKPKMEFETEVIDYGTIKHNADGVRFFKFENTGSAPLIIKSVKGSCGCTVPTKPEKPIMPGEVGEIKVKYATNRVGRFTKTVTIVSNASEHPKVVKIKGEVLKD